MLYDPLRIFLPVSEGLIILGILAWVLGVLNAGRLLFPNSTIFLFSAALLTVLLGLISNQLVNTRIHYYGDEALTIYEDENDPAPHP
jgi:hypothetical protein